MIANDFHGKPVVLILDPDAREEANRIVIALNEAGCHTVPVWLPDGYDCNDYDPVTIWNIIRSQCRERGIIIPTNL